MNQLNVTELTRFFGEFAHLSREAGRDDASARIDPSALQEFFSGFSALFRSGVHPGGGETIFDACRLGRDEPRNCSVLAWLLDGNASHGLGSAFLRGMLEKCGLGRTVAHDLAAGYAVRTEFCPNADNADRVDIVCDGRDFLLYLEVKIDSFEHGDQTERYHKKLLNNAGGRDAALIFLSTGDAPASPQARRLTWRDCAEVLEETAENGSGAAPLIRQYAAFIRKF